MATVQIFTALEQGELLPNRGLRGYFKKITTLDGKVIASEGPHVLLVMPGEDAAAMIADVNADITTRAGMEWPAVDEGHAAQFIAACQLFHTPEVIAAYEAWKASQP
jgi:hypothetical protein